MSESKKNVLVLGAFGFIGSHLCRALLRAGYQVKAFGKQNSNKHLIFDISDELKVVEGDVGSCSDVLAAMDNVDVVFHAIHTTVPGSSMRDPVFDVKSNVELPLNWISRLNETSVKKIIYISSGGTVYGIPQSEGITEQHATNPICSYGITKLMNEKYLSMYSSMYGLQCIIVRPSNIYGPGQRLDKGQGVIGVLLSRTLHGEPLEVWGTGEALRDYLFIDDAIEGLVRLVDYSGKQEVFNLSSGIGYSVSDIIATLEELLGSPMTVQYKPSNRYDVPVNVLDSTHFQQSTGWEPRVSLDKGIERLVLSYTEESL